MLRKGSSPTAVNVVDIFQVTGNGTRLNGILASEADNYLV
jgi:hypothetical protein